MYPRNFMIWLNAEPYPRRGGILSVLQGRKLLWAMLLVTVVAVPASAQSASFRSVDTDRNGVLTFDELVTAFGREGANRLLRSTDYNGDVRITLFELRRGPGDDRDDDDRSSSSNERDDDRDDDRDDTGDDGGDDGDDDGGDDD